jgi:S1-C subfamily serine protease
MVEEIEELHTDPDFPGLPTRDVASLQTLVAKVSPAVVEVLVTGLGPVEETDEDKTALVGRQSKEGSGVIVDPGGYIVTNAHVVGGARSIEVVVSSRSQENESEDKRYPAHLVGVHKDTDLALLKIDATSLPYLPLDPKRPITQGQLVFALGNPEGLGNSVTMGVVSAVDRQPDPKSSRRTRRSIPATVVARSLTLTDTYSASIPSSCLRAGGARGWASRFLPEL